MWKKTRPLSHIGSSTYITYNVAGYTSKNILLITVCDTIMVKSMKMAAARKCKRHLLLFEDVFIRNLCPYRSAHLAATLPSGRMISVHLPIEQARPTAPCWAQSSEQQVSRFRSFLERKHQLILGKCRIRKDSGLGLLSSASMSIHCSNAMVRDHRGQLQNIYIRLYPMLTKTQLKSIQ
jgi:hypothetical protein